MPYPTFTVTILGNEYTLIDVDGDQSNIINEAALSIYDKDVLNWVSDESGDTFRDKMGVYIMDNGKTAAYTYEQSIMDYNTFRFSVYSAGSDGKPVGQIAVRNNPTNNVVITTATSDDSLSDITADVTFLRVPGLSSEVDSGIGFDGEGLEVSLDGTYYFSGWASIRHSANTATVGILFGLKRDGVIIGTTASAVPSRMPNTGDIGQISGGGIVTLQAGDVIIPLVGSDKLGTVTVENITVDGCFLKS